MGKIFVTRRIQPPPPPPLISSAAAATLPAHPPSVSPLPFPIKDLTTSNSSPVGIQHYLDSILETLKSGGSPTVGIWGPGGIGKTTLLRSVHRATSSLFDFVIWSVASVSCNPESVQRDIASRLGLMLPADASPKTVTQSIFRCLHNRSFLLLLDDLWSALDLSLLGIPDPRAASAALPRRAVVFTTRYREVCTTMERRCRLIRLDCLSADDAFVLFAERTGGADSLNADPRIRKIADEIINDYCQRMPLALTATGTALSSKRTYEEWAAASKNLKRSSANFPGMGKSFFPLLKLSYDNLDDEAKSCFLSCALWPENYSICVDELIGCWMGLGFIDEQDVGVAYSRGRHVMCVLKAASLLMPGDVEREVRIHQTIRGLALWIASVYGEKREKWMVNLDSSSLRTGAHHFNWINAERVSFMYNDIETVPLQTNRCEGLTTLILKGNMSLTSISPGFFARLPALTYMDLSHTGIEELPVDIRRLSKLKYLNLSHTSLNSLPMEVEHLKELQYLILYMTLNLKPIPRKVLSGLSKLRVLDITASGYGYDLGFGAGGGASVSRPGANIQDLECFGRDQKRRSVLALGIMVVSLKALSRLSMLSGVSTRRLWMNNLEGLGTLDLLSPNLLGNTNVKIGKSLMDLTIMNCDRLEKIMMVGCARGGAEKKAAHATRLPGLEKLQFLELRRMKEIIWHGVMAEVLLPCLRELTIYRCDKLKNVSWVLKLPSLEYLQLQECTEMEEVVNGNENSGNGVNGQAFPMLKAMILDELPCLAKICNQALAFPALESLQVSGCPRLKKLPFGPDIRSNKLKKIQGEKMWWECLQWEDKSIKRELLDCFFFIPPRAPLTTLPSRRSMPVEKAKNSSPMSFYRAVLLPISLPFMLLSLSAVLPPSILFLCVFLLFVARWGLLQRCFICFLGWMEACKMSELMFLYVYWVTAASITYPLDFS